MARGARLAGLPVALLLLALATPSAAELRAAPEPTVAPDLEGRAVDPAGRALAGVEVLVSGALSGGGDFLRARSDDAGRFALSGLAPGLYRITALKGGYQVSVTRVNTLVRRTLDLVLHPSLNPEVNMRCCIYHLRFNLEIFKIIRIDALQ